MRRIIAINAKKFSTYLVGLIFILAGFNHFINSELLCQNHAALYSEAPNVGLRLRSLRTLEELVFCTRHCVGLLDGVSSGLVELLVAVLPLHLHMIIHQSKYQLIPYAVLFARIPLQFILIACVEWSTRIRYEVKQCAN